MADAPQPPAPQKRGVAEWMRSHLVITVLGAFILGALAGAGGSGGTPTSPPVASDSTEEEAKPEPTEEEEPEPEPEPEPEFDRPTKDDFDLNLKKVSESCFGSAGCNTELRVVLRNTSGIELDPTKTYELRYRIVGAEDPLMATMEVTGRNYTVNEHYISTPTGAQLDAVVLSISEF